MIKFLARRRFNYINAVAIGGLSSFVTQGEYLKAIVFLTTMMFTSAVAEIKAGVFDD